MIFGSNAICRYFSYKGVSSSLKGVTADLTGAVEEWLDWEAMTLAPAERLLATSKEAGGSAPAETLAALKHLEEKLTGKWLLDGVSRHDVDCPLVAQGPALPCATKLPRRTPKSPVSSPPLFARKLRSSLAVRACVLEHLERTYHLLDFDARRQESPSLADIVVGVTAKAVVVSLGQDEAECSFVKVKAYAQRIGELAACAQAANAIGAFTEASTRDKLLWAPNNTTLCAVAFRIVPPFSVSCVYNHSIRIGCNRVGEVYFCARFVFWLQ